MNTNHRRNIIIAILVFFIGLITTWVLFHPIAFDPQTWKSARTPHDFAVRYRMRNSAMEMIRTGNVKSTNEVLSYFGKSDFGDEIPGRWRYRMESPRLIRIDSLWLGIIFNEKGEITSYHIESD